MVFPTLNDVTTSTHNITHAQSARVISTHYPKLYTVKFCLPVQSYATYATRLASKGWCFLARLTPSLWTKKDKGQSASETTSIIHS